MYEADFAEIYDCIHESRGKDYAAEVEELACLVRARKPDASSVLDVACGTGRHLEHLCELFDRGEGLELSADMLVIAAKRVPGTRLHRADMREFSLGTTFDAVICMFSSVGYLRNTNELRQTLSCFAGHLNTGGVIVIEPWVFPEAFLPGYISADVAETGERTVLRASHSVREGNTTKMEVHYIHATATGIRHLTDTHRLTLFTRDEYETAFENASCTVEYIDSDRFPRGMSVIQNHSKV